MALLDLQDGTPLQLQDGSDLELQNIPRFDSGNVLVNHDFRDGLDSWIEVNAGSRVLLNQVSKNVFSTSSLVGGASDALGQNYQEGTMLPAQWSNYHVSGWFGSSFNDTDHAWVRLRLYDAGDLELVNVTINNVSVNGPRMDYKENTGVVPPTAVKWRVDVYTTRVSGTSNNCSAHELHLEFDKETIWGDTDPNNDNVISRVTFEGAQGAQVVTDKAFANYTVWEVGGNAHIAENDGPFPGTNSMRFDGVGDYIKAIGLPTLAGDFQAFTLRFWIRFDSLAAGQGMVVFGRPDVTNNNRYQMGINTSGDIGFFQSNELGTSYNGQPGVPIGSSGLSPATWHHLTLVSDGRYFGWFNDGVWINGKMIYTGTSTSVSSRFMNLLWLGAARVANAMGGMSGNIADVQLIEGINVPTTSFVPPTGPLPAPTYPEPASDDLWDYTTVMHPFYDTTIDAVGDGDGTFSGGAAWNRQCPVEKWGPNAAYFDGNGAFLSKNNYSILGQGASRAMTMEAWVYLVALPPDQAVIYSNRNDPLSGSGGLTWAVLSTGELRFVGWTTGGVDAFSSWPISTPTVPVGEWVYVAVEHDGAGDFYLNVNGTVDGPFTATGTLGWGDAAGYIGLQREPVSNLRCWNGWIAEMRFTVGKARYGMDGTNIPVPTEPFPRIATRPAVGDGDDLWEDTVYNVITHRTASNEARVSDARGIQLWDYIDNARPDSMLLEATQPTGRALRVYDGESSLYPLNLYGDDGFPAGPFCIEIICYNNGSAQTSGRIWKSRGNDNITGVMVTINNTDQTSLMCRLSTTGTTWTLSLPTATAKFAVGEMHHICIERDDTDTVRLLIDGVTEASGVLAGALHQSYSLYPSIGGNYSGVDRSFDSWVHQVRVTIGDFRHGGNYTPSPFTELLPWAHPDWLLPPTGPVFTTQPGNVSVDEFDTAIFQVVVVGNEPITYQWYNSFDGLLAGETSPTLSFTASFSQTGFSYWCVATDVNTEQTQSTNGLLTVTEVQPPVIVVQPQPQFVESGSPAVFSVTATGAVPLTYQWYETNVGIMPGEVSNQITIVPTPADSGRSFYCEVRDVHAQLTTSDTAGITVVVAPVIIQQPVDTEAVEFREVSFTVQAVGSGPFTYDWHNDIDGQLTVDSIDPIYTFTAALADDGKVFWVVVRDFNLLETQSDNATLDVSASVIPDVPPFLDIDITGPNNVIAELGMPAQFTVAVGSSVAVHPVVIDWYNDRDGLIEADGDEVYDFTPDGVDNGLEYYVIVTDDNGAQGQSRFATLTLTGAILELSWSVTAADPDKTILQYQNIGWSVFDAFGENQAVDFDCPVRAHRGLYDDGRTYWIPFYDKSARASRGPLVNDLHNRYYWTQDNEDMRYAPLQNLELDSRTTGAVVGVPAPRVSPKLAAPVGSDSAQLESRAYVYTYVSIYGEEGPPSPPVVRNGDADGRWVLTEMETGPTDGKLRRLTTKRIYRTVTAANGDTDYYRVASLPITVSRYTDSKHSADVVLNPTLESTNWFPPPEGLSGLTAHPNGFFVGFVGRDIYFSEPYRPHAWNPAYVVSTLGAVVGFGIYGSTIVVATASFPYTLTGIHPAAMVMDQHDTPEPCVARYGIVSMPFGVYFPSPNGLMLASPNGFQNATKELMTKEEWQNRYNVTQLDAAQYQSQYVAFYSSTKGVMFAPDEPMAALVDLDLTGSAAEPDQMQTIFTDEYSGKTYLIEDCNMYEWNPVSGAPLEYDWTSMEFDAADPVNFGAARIIWYSRWTPPTEEQTQLWRDYNVARMAEKPLNPFNFHALNASRDVDTTGFENFPEIKQPFSWSPLIWVPNVGEPWPNTPYVVMELIANEEVVFTQEIDDTGIFRLPSGWKATRFKIRLRSNVPIQSCKVAETGKELARV